MREGEDPLFLVVYDLFVRLHAQVSRSRRSLISAGKLMTLHSFALSLVCTNVQSQDSIECCSSDLHSINKFKASLCRHIEGCLSDS